MTHPESTTEAQISEAYGVWDDKHWGVFRNWEEKPFTL